MPEDRKYGHVTLERGTVGEDEPVVVFRAQDALLPLLLERYYTLCADNRSPQTHLEGILADHRQILAWQRDHFTQVPRSDPAGGSDG